MESRHEYGSAGGKAFQGRPRGLRLSILGLLAGWGSVVAVCGSEYPSALEEFKIKRQELFAFARKPTLSRQGDRVEIAFAAQGACDATVAIEDAQGKIVRHLASGVLGAHAPEPFRQDTLAQTLVWDGKDDRGAYRDDQASLSVRVSLGLRPQFERTLYSDPHKRLSSTSPVLCAAPEGVYVFDGEVVDSLRLFDHDGNYVRTVYPFPAEKVSSFADLHWRVFPQDQARLPLKEGEHQATLLASGDNAGFKDFGIGPKHQAGSGGSALAVQGNRIALVKQYLSRFATDGAASGVPLKGAQTSYSVVNGAQTWNGGGKSLLAPPHSAAFSPDGQWVYLTGFHWREFHGTGGYRTKWVHGLVRVQYEGSAAPEVLAGSVKQGEYGAGEAKLGVPVAVACDAQGRVYVADYMNDRIQVFSAEGKFRKSLPAFKPAWVAVHPRSGEIFVGSWTLKSDELLKVAGQVRIQPVLHRLGALEDPRPLAKYALPLEHHAEQTTPGDFWGGTQWNLSLDAWSDPPRLWLVPGAWAKAGLRIYRLGNGKLDLLRDFGAEVRKSVVRDEPPKYLRQRLYVNPKSGTLYLAEPDAGVGKSLSQLLEIDPVSGGIKPLELPYDAEDFAFDADGLIYLRALSDIGRFDPATWREVPWDYGEERSPVGFASSKGEGAGQKSGALISSLRLPVQRYNHHGGMMVSLKGHLAVGIHGGQEPAENRAEVSKPSASGKPFTFRLFPGRGTYGLVQVFDKDGKVLQEDAIPGIAFTHGVGIDRDEGLYVMAMAARCHDGQRHFNEATDTLLKFNSGQGRILCTNASLPLEASARPKVPPQLSARSGGRLESAWVEGAAWMYGGVGFHARHGAAEGFGCDCFNSRFDLDYFARSFVPEVEHYSVAVLDRAGNLILRLGKYGNADDGRPLQAAGGSPNPRSCGGDEVALFYPCYVATQTDRRLFIADTGNMRIVSVQLDYHASERVRLGSVPDKTP